MTEPMTLRVRVNAGVEEVHRALTEADQLRSWLAEHAEVELPDRYAFWGRHTPEGDAPHQRLLHVDERTVRFAWLLDGEETTTELRLDPEPDGAATLVTLTQTHFDFADVMTGASIRGVLQTFWSLALANLVDHLEGRELTPKVDFTSADLRAEVTVAASPERVFDSITDSAKVSTWFGFPIEIEPYVGGRFAMGGLENNPQPAMILDLEPNRRMSVDWGPTGVGTWELEGSEGRTRITLVQSGFDGTRPPYAAWGGILAGIAGLRRFHELPDQQPVFAE